MKHDLTDGHQGSGQNSVTGEDFLSQFYAPADEVADTLPVEIVPCRHMEPVLDDPSISFPAWDTIFGKDLNLTDVQEGLRSQKINRNITEISKAILHRYEFMSVSGCLAVYMSPCWRVLNREEAFRFIQEAVEDLFPADAKYLNDRQYRDIVSLLQHDRGTMLLKGMPAPDYSYLCCRDYMYDWRSGNCLPHGSSYRRFSCLDLDASAIGNCDGRHWEMFLDNLTNGDNNLRRRILEMIGVILSGYPIKAFFFLEGPSGTGKSQLVNVLRNVLGESACVALNDISQLGQKWTTGSLFGKLLCLCGDIPDAPLDSKTIGTIKQLTGDDLIRGEFKYKDAFTFENTAKLLFVSNYPLRIPNQAQEQAFLDRLITIPCRNPVPRECQIPAIHRLLHQEAGYIVDLAMEALRTLIARKGAFTPLPEALSAVQFQMPDCEQMVADFIQECCLLEEGASCSVSEVFQAFQNYFIEAEMDVGQFSKILCRIYPQIGRKRSSNVRKLYGLRLMDANPENPS